MKEYLMNHGESTVIETVNAAKPNFKKEELLNAMKYRYATKRFSEKTIPPEDFEVLLETARLAPTSFGLETWKILVIQDKTLREEMKEFGWGIKDKLDASHFVVFLARKKVDITFGSDYIRHMLKDVHQVPDEVYEFYRNAYSNFSENDFKTLESERSAFDWAGKQAYIVMAHMMAVAALMGIDSCPLEGFIPKEMDRLLGEEHGLFDTEHFGIAVMAAFGYRGEDVHRNKTRRPLSESVLWK